MEVINHIILELRARMTYHVPTCLIPTLPRKNLLYDFAVSSVSKLCLQAQILRECSGAQETHELESASPSNQYPPDGGKMTVG